MMEFHPVVDWPKLPTAIDLVDVVAIAIDAEDNIYVFNRGHTPIVVLDPAGDLLASWGSGLFTEPHGLHVTGDGSLYCVDYGDHTVRQFTLEGRLLRTLGTAGQPSDTGVQGRDWRTIRRAAGPFNAPTDVVTTPDGDIFVSDGYGNACVHHFTSDGALQTSWGALGDGEGEFWLPHNIVLDKAGLLHVSDRENNRIQRFTTEGNFVSALDGVHRPNAALPTPDGLTYVAELGYRTVVALQEEAPPGRPHSVVTIWTTDGESILRIGGEDPAAPGSFCAAHALAIDSSGDLYVGDVGWSAHAGQPPAGIRPIQKLRRIR